MSYKGLNLEHHKIEETIVSFLNRNYPSAKYEKDPQRGKEVYTITIDDKIVKFEVYLNKSHGGTITLHYKLGKNQEIGEKIAEYIKKTLINDERANVTVTLKNMEIKDIDELFEYLNECDFSDENINKISRPINHGVQYFFSREKTGEKISLILYNTGNLVISGKPIFLFMVTKTYFIGSGRLKLEESISSYTRIEIDRGEISSELESIIPSAFNKIHDNIKEMILSSLILEKINVDMFDYTVYVFPVLKGLEACMKSIFKDKEVKIDNSFYCFNGFCLNEKTKAIINEETTSNQLEKMYKYLKMNRHTLFHHDQDIEMTRKIETKEKAVELIYETLNLIDESYQILSLN